MRLLIMLCLMLSLASPSVAAESTIADGSTMGVVRGQMNTMFGELYDFDEAHVIGVDVQAYAAALTAYAVASNAVTATALAANGANCTAGSYPLGVDASGAVEDCTVAGPATVEGTAVLSTGEVGGTKFLREDGDGTSSWQTPAGSGDMSASTYDPATIAEQLVGLTATQTLTNKTITSPSGIVTNDITESIDANYVSDAHLVVIGNTSGTNTGDAPADDTVYGVGWNGDTTTAPSKNAVYDKIETIAGGHDAVTLAAGVNALTLSTQEIGVDATVEQIADLTPVNNALLGFDASGNIEAKSSILVDIELDTAASTTSGIITYNSAKLQVGNGSTTDYFSSDTLNAASYAAALGVDDNYVTDAQLVIVGNASGTNTGDQNAANVSVDASGFNGNLTTSDTTVQAVAQKVDDLLSGSSGYVATPPTYSDETCTAGQYSLSTTTGYVCVTSGDWNTFSLTDWNNPTPSIPTLSSVTIDTLGTSLTLVGSESLSVGAGGNSGFDIDCATAGTDITATYSSGAPGTSLVYTLGTTVNSGDTCDIDYTQPGDGIEATTGGGDLASIVSSAVANNSTASGAAAGLVGNQCVVITSTAVIGGINEAGLQTYTAATTGQISYVHVALDYTTTSDTFNVAIYDVTGTTKLAESNLQTFTATGWNHFALDSPITITAGVDYMLVVGSKTDTGWRAAAEGTVYATSLYVDNAATIEDIMPSTITEDTFITASDLCIYADNSSE